MKKIVFNLFLMLVLASGMGSGMISAHAAEQQEEDVNGQRPGIEARTLVTTAWGTTKGDIVPYRSGAAGTGQITVHFTAKNSGFVDGDKSVYTLMLPDELKEVAANSQFGTKIEGTVRNSTMLGEKKTEITPNMVDAYSDRVYVSIPGGCWIGVGNVRVDLKIRYGEILDVNPNLKIPDVKKGYQFKSGLRYTSASWDIIKKPLLGTDGSRWKSAEKSMIIQSDTMITSASFKVGDKVIRGTYSGDDIADSKVYLNGENLNIEHDDSSFFKDKINIYGGNKFSEVQDDDYLMVKCYDANNVLLDVYEVDISL